MGALGDVERASGGSRSSTVAYEMKKNTCKFVLFGFAFFEEEQSNCA